MIPAASLAHTAPRVRERGRRPRCWSHMSRAQSGASISGGITRAYRRRCPHSERLVPPDPGIEPMASITSVAEAFFEACETGKGWEGCQRLLHARRHLLRPGRAAARGQDARAVHRLDEGHHGVLPDGRYELKSFATDEARNNVAAYAVFHGTHTGQGGPVPPTGKQHQHRLRLRDAVRGRQDRPHDEDLARRAGDEGARLGLNGQNTMNRITGWVFYPGQPVHPAVKSLFDRPKHGLTDFFAPLGDSTRHDHCLSP